MFTLSGDPGSDGLEKAKYDAWMSRKGKYLYISHTPSLLCMVTVGFFGR